MSNDRLQDISRKINFCNLFHMKISANVNKSAHQDRGPCYLHLHAIFFSHMHSLLLKKKVIVVITVFFSKLDRKLMFQCIYYKTVLM